MAKMLCIDLFCGLGGWTEGFLAEGWRVVGFDIERHQYGSERYLAQLVLQDVLTLHGSQFKKADCIVASPPCTEFSYMHQPWPRAQRIKNALWNSTGDFPPNYEGSRTISDLTELFYSCFRIQREAIAAADRHIPLVVENVVGAQRWMGAAKAHFGAYYLWGDVGQVSGRVAIPSRLGLGNLAPRGIHPPKSIFDDVKNGQRRGKQTAARFGSQSIDRKMNTSVAAKIPFPLSSFIARILKPQ